MNRVYLTYAQMTKIFREVESSSNKKTHVDGYIVFSQESFHYPFSEKARTYAVSSNNKAFQPNMGGYSIFYGINGTGPCVRLDCFMAAEKGGKDGWKVESCYMNTDNLSTEVMEIINRITGGKPVKIDLFGVAVEAKEVTWFELNSINLYDHDDRLKYYGYHYGKDSKDVYALFMSRDETSKYCVKLDIII